MLATKHKELGGMALSTKQSFHSGGLPNNGKQKAKAPVKKTCVHGLREARGKKAGKIEAFMALEDFSEQDFLKKRTKSIVNIIKIIEVAA